jgi:hypothetical protein
MSAWTKYNHSDETNSRNLCFFEPMSDEEASALSAETDISQSHPIWDSQTTIDWSAALCVKGCAREPLFGKDQCCVSGAREKRASQYHPVSD